MRYLALPTALLSLFLFATPAGAQERVSIDLFAGKDVPVGALAEIAVDDDETPYNGGIGINYRIDDEWTLALQSILHQYVENPIQDPRILGASHDMHLQLWDFFLVLQREVIRADGLRLRARGGVGVTHTSSDRSSFDPPGDGFSHLLPAMQLGLDAGYALGFGEVFGRVGGNVTFLPGDESEFFRQRSNGEIGTFHTLVRIPLSVGLRLKLF